MMTTLPAVQHNCRHIHIKYGRKAKRDDKRNANRRYRRVLNRTTKSFELDPELFDDEVFNAPSWSNWDID